MSQTPAIAGLLLAAGGSRRLGQPKQLLETGDGEPLVRMMARRLLDAGCLRVLVVLGANADAVRQALEPLSSVGRVQVFEHAAWADGMGSSIAAGVTVLDADATLSGVLIAACDMPSVTSAHLRSLIDPVGEPSGVGRSASTYDTPDGELITGIPAVFPRTDFAALRRLSGDRGARALLREADISLIALVDGNLDVDTPDDLRRWRLSPNS